MPILICLFGQSEQMPATSISKTVWTVPVQARITICRPKGQKEPPPEFAPKRTNGSGGNANTNEGRPQSGWPLGFVPPEKKQTAGSVQQQQPQDNFEDMKKMMPMKWGWAEVPVGNDRPTDDEERRRQLWMNLPECP